MCVTSCCTSTTRHTGWLVMMDRGHVLFALILVLMSSCCSIICVCESYRALAATLPILQSQERTCDVWVMRLLVQNPLALLATWVTLHATLTFALFLTFGMKEHRVMPETGSLVQLCTVGFLVFAYVLMDLTILDQHTRFVVLPYIGMALFSAAQLTKDWPSAHSPVFILVAGLTAFTFLAIFVKAVALMCRYAPHAGEGEAISLNIVTRPLASDLEEETYLLRDK
ncbi:uncharacterized protein LOC143276449 isoform X2 [Babylonia areolata]|uniref:uncharacterized protein LOC143276449 isoform X2 n=1 Tax=Babylonia areolata TaxID=304850 RepID=UPI003FD5E3F1